MHYSFNTVKTEHHDNLPVVVLRDVIGREMTISTEIFYLIVDIYVRATRRNQRLPYTVQYDEIDSDRPVIAEFEHIGNRNYISIHNGKFMSSFPVDFLIEVYQHL